MPPVTTVLLAANVAVFFLSALAPGLAMSLALWPLGSEGAFRGGGFGLWQLFTYAFLHGGLMHLFVNMFGLYMFGSPLEHVFGARRYLAYYFSCVLSAAIVQLLVLRMTGSFVPTVGASGGVFGLLLGFAMLFPNQRVMLLFPPIPMRARTFAVVYAVVELMLGVTNTNSGVAHFAHLGGMLGGFMLLRQWGFSWRR